MKETLIIFKHNYINSINNLNVDKFINSIMNSEELSLIKENQEMNIL